MWGWIKKWFDPITTSKIFILSSQEVLPTLSTFIDVENIPKKYGGGLDFECGMPPVLDPAVRKYLTMTPSQNSTSELMFLTAPVKWMEHEDGDLVAMGVGSLNGKARDEPLAILHSHAAQNAMPLLSRHNTQVMSTITPTMTPNTAPQPHLTASSISSNTPANASAPSIQHPPQAPSQPPAPTNLDQIQPAEIPPRPPLERFYTPATESSQLGR